MLVIVPQAITEDSIVSYNIPEAEPDVSAYDADVLYLAGTRVVYGYDIYQAVAGVELGSVSAWAAGTAYVPGGKAYLESTHRIYQANTDTTGQDPASYTTGESPVWTEIGVVNRGVSLDDTNYWVKVGATNYWGMFDPYTDTQTVGIASDDGFEIAVGLNASKCNAVSLFNVVGDYVELTVSREGVTLWTQTVQLVERASKTYSDFFFGRNITVRRSFFVKFPVYFSTTLTVRVVGASAAKCGMINLGYIKNIATTNYGVNLSIVDYSKVTTNDFGITSISKGRVKKKHSIPLRVRTNQVNEFYRFFQQEIPSTPCTFVGDNDGSYECMTVYGIYQNFSVVVGGPVISDCSLDILGIN